MTTSANPYTGADPSSDVVTSENMSQILIKIRIIKFAEGVQSRISIAHLLL